MSPLLPERTDFSLRCDQPRPQFPRGFMRLTTYSCPNTRHGIVWCVDSLSVSQFSCSVMSSSLRPHGLQHARLVNLWKCHIDVEKCCVPSVQPMCFTSGTHSCSPHQDLDNDQIPPVSVIVPMLLHRLQYFEISIAFLRPKQLPRI